MTSGDTRKQRELHILQRFLESANIAAEIACSREAPDFELITEGRSVGVEVTEIYNPAPPTGPPMQARESLEDRILAAARRIYERRGGRHLHLSAAFFGGVDVTRLHRDSTAEAIARLVASLPLNELGHTAWRNEYRDSSLDAVAFLNVLPVPEASMSHWYVARAGWVSPLATEVLQAAIDEKNRKVPEYRRDFNELWLLLATDSGRPSQMFASDVPPVLNGVTSLFDRTYLFRMFSGMASLVHRSDA